MSSNRLMYDTCAYKQNLAQSTSPLSHIMDMNRRENCNKCRHELGLLGGPTASIITGNLVDLENELRGQYRQTTQCPDKLYKPQCSGTNLGDQCNPKQLTVTANGCDKPRVINTEPLHLRPCMMLHYKPVHLPEPMKQSNICESQSSVFPVPSNCQSSGSGVPAAYNL